MKSKFLNKTILLGAVALTGSLTSCEDYLTLYPTDSITKEDFWNSRNDVENVRAAAYYQMTQTTSNILTWGEFRSDNLVLNKMDQKVYRYLQDAVLQPSENIYSWQAMYQGINYCNEVLENGQKMLESGKDPSFTESDWAPIKAEMTGLRSLYYFYLVRAFRSVPYVTKSVSSDAEAMAARIEATPGDVILENLIADVEAVLPVAAVNYGSAVDNKGRFNYLSLRALLADMYLWRACMVKSASKKGFPITNEEGATLTKEQESALSAKLLEKTVEYADYVLKELKREYDERLAQQTNPLPLLKNQPFPLIRSTAGGFLTFDVAYNSVFGSKNSTESILELQFDGTNVSNKTLGNMFFGNPSGSYTTGVMAANPVLFSSVASVDPAKGYGRTDLRFLSYAFKQEGASNTYSIIKGVATDVAASDATDMSKGYNSVFSAFRNHNNQTASWPVYRLADIMLIKAEAIARLKHTDINNPNYYETTAYHLVNNLFARNNPGADSSANTSLQHHCPRLRSENVAATRYANYSNNLLYLVYCERQREFLGEGKRWFDIVRECEFRGETKDVLNDWVGSATNVRNRLRSIWSLYNPIYLEEMKVNGVGFGNAGGKLVQNPVWEKYMPNTIE